MNDRHLGWQRFFLGLALWVAFFSFGCETDPPQHATLPNTHTGKADGVESKQDILSTALFFDLATRQARATIRTAPILDGSELTFEVGNLSVAEVRSETGPLEHHLEDKRLHIALPEKTSPAEITVEYGFGESSGFDGLLPSGSTSIWPYHCGNLFPCSSDPADGLIFDLNLTGIPTGMKAVFPSRIPGQAPSYMIAWAVGDYTYKEIGHTEAGTKIGVYWLPGQEKDALEGTAKLDTFFDWLEKNIGPYTFGSEAASVSVAWGPGAYGGMEHHPFWHISQTSLHDLSTHVHEAAHGWFGDGVRIRCWEDFVLSEGTVSYLTARAMGAVRGSWPEERVWNNYRWNLTAAVKKKDGIAWPDSCGKVDILKDGLFSSIPYMKGAFFFRAVAKQIGVQKLDEVLAHFYQKHVGTAQGMQDLLDAIQEETGFDPTPLAQAWLRSLGVPQDG